MELGQTQNAVDLIPGSPSSARMGAAEWREIATRAGDARAAFAKLDDEGSWSGAAYEKYVERFEQQLSYWQSTSDTFTAAANALDNYAGALEWAQGEAALAIELWNAAEAESAAALAEHKEYVSSLRQGTGIRHVEVDVPFVDPSGPAHREAQAVLANARYQLDVLATGYANTIGEAGEAAPLPLTPEQAQQAATDAVVRTVIEVAVVQPFLSTLNFLGGIAQTLWEHPDLVLEMLGGIIGIVGGGALIVGGGGLEVVTVGAGTPVAVPAIAGGVAAAGAGATLLNDSLNRMFNEAKTADRQPGVDRGDGRDHLGHWVNRDPDAPIPDHALKEQQGIKEVEADLESAVLRDKVKAHVEGESQDGRLYDGLVQLPDGTYAGVEIKSGGAYSDYWGSSGTQKHFDDLIRGGEHAYATLNGERIEISNVIVHHVP